MFGGYFLFFIFCSLLNIGCVFSSNIAKSYGQSSFLIKQLNAQDSHTEHQKAEELDSKKYVSDFALEFVNLALSSINENDKKSMDTLVSVAENRIGYIKIAEFILSDAFFILNEDDKSKVTKILPRYLIGSYFQYLKNNKKCKALFDSIDEIGDEYLVNIALDCPESKESKGQFISIRVYKDSVVDKYLIYDISMNNVSLLVAERRMFQSSAFNQEKNLDNIIRYFEQQQ